MFLGCPSSSMGGSGTPVPPQYPCRGVPVLPPQDRRGCGGVRDVSTERGRFLEDATKKEPGKGEGSPPLSLGSPTLCPQMCPSKGTPWDPR